MALQVILLQAGSTRPPDWRQTRPPDLTQLGLGNEEEWRFLCGSILAWAQREPGAAIEIFFCLEGRGLMMPSDRVELERLLTLARNHSWGAKLWLVTSHKHTRRLVEWRESWRLWMRIAIEGRALGVLQVDYGRTIGAPAVDASLPTTQQLRQAADRMESQYRHLPGPLTLSQAAWSCAAGDPSLFNQLAHDLAASPAATCNVMVLVDHLVEADQVRALKNAWAKYPNRCRLVATLHQASPALLQQCERYELPVPLDVRGAFELWYLLLRLNDTAVAVARMTIDDLAPAGPRPYSIAGVETDRAPVFRSLRGRPALAEILVTSSFDLAEDQHWPQAAKDIGNILLALPLGLRVVVEPAITRGRLIARVAEMPDLMTWIHLGHGAHCVLPEAPTGEPRSGAWVDAETWLACFRVTPPALALVIFLACHSDEIALSFAKAGTSVAVGFTGKIATDLARVVAVQILHWAYYRGMDIDPILEGFRRGCVSLATQRQPRLTPYPELAAAGTQDSANPGPEPIAYHCGPRRALP